MQIKSRKTKFLSRFKEMIPVVDFAAYGLNTRKEEADPNKVKLLEDQICHAFKDIGFVYLKHHGITKSIIEDIFSISKEFFEKPVEVKQNYARSLDVTNNHGWVALEREKLNPERPAADLKEAYNFQLVDDKQTLPLDILPDFHTVFSSFYKQCQELTYRVLDLMCMGLDINKDYFRECHHLVGKQGNATTLRSLYYPPLSNGVKPGQVRCGEHSDYGTVTLLFQDDIGGLEVKPSNCDYVPAIPIEDTVLVNLGDLMQRWTADKLVATVAPPQGKVGHGGYPHLTEPKHVETIKSILTYPEGYKHRVLIPDEEVKRNQGRQSLAFFVHPDDHVVIECLDKSNKYQPMSSIDYLNMRFSATY